MADCMNGVQPRNLPSGPKAREDHRCVVAGVHAVRVAGLERCIELSDQVCVLVHVHVLYSYDTHISPPKKIKKEGCPQSWARYYLAVPCDSPRLPYSS